MTPTLELDLRDVGDLRRALSQHLPAGGVFVTASPPPRLFEAVDVAIRLPDESFRMLRGQVVNHAPTGAFVVLSDPAALATLIADTTAMLPSKGEVEEPDGEVEEPDGEVEEPDGEVEDADTEDEEEPDEDELTGPLVSGTARPSWDLLDTSSDVPLHKQVANLSVNDRIRIARHANRPVRRILIRDLEKRIHVEVVKNPQVRDDEAIEYAGTAGLSPIALEWMANQSRFLKNKKMLMTLVTNPMTPQRVARKLLDKLSNREILKVLRSPRSREAIVRECRKRLMKAGIL